MEHMCPQCKSEVSELVDSCPNCGSSLLNNQTGQFTNYTPDDRKVHIDPTKNVRLNSDDVVFNSLNKKFVAASEIREEENEVDETRRRLNDYPDIEAVPRRSWESKEFKFKGLEARPFRKRHHTDDNNTDDISFTADALAIDG